ncbi:MAG: FAD-dependent monooxygenase [Mycobacterium sp.]
MTDYTGASAIVIGGSIGGLTTALLLRDLGFRVDIYERTATALDGRGSGIVLQPDTVRWFTERSTQDLADLSTSTSYVQYLDRTGDLVYREKCTWTYTSWGTFYRALLADFNSHSATEHYHYGEYACGFDQSDGVATVRFVSGRVESADLVVFADGVTSVARERFDADAGLRYSGYIGWRGTFPLRELSPQTRAVLHDAITYDFVPDSHITMYPIPGENSVSLDDRLMNYVWYRNVPAGPELTEMCIDKRGFPGAVSVHPGQVQDRYVAQMKQDATELLAPAVAEVVTATKMPYLQVVSDARSARMALGRVALIGDAACAARPHAAAGTAKAAADGWALAAALADAGGDIPAALTKWEPAQLQLSDSLLRRVVAMGERSQFTNTWIPGDPDLRFGLYGPGK